MIQEGERVREIKVLQDGQMGRIWMPNGKLYHA